MDLARVEGTVVSTAKTESLHGYKLLVITLLNPDTSPTKNQLVAIDTVGAGCDEIVLVVRGSSARQAEGLETVPSDASIVAIVDCIAFREKIVYEKLEKEESS
jgi:carbon dioxide concentrating mechanism protein CcmL